MADMKLCCRVWDIFLFDGREALMRIALAMFQQVSAHCLPLPQQPTPAHRLYPVPTPTNVLSPNILCASYVHPMYTTCVYAPCAPYVYPICILCAPYVHPICILCASYVHPMCTLCAILCASYVHTLCHPMCTLRAPYYLHTPCHLNASILHLYIVSVSMFQHWLEGSAIALQ